VKRIDKQIDQFLGLIVEASNASVIKAYERKISELEQEKILTHERIAQAGKPRQAREELFELAFKFL